jgi:hypothetical protein
MKHNLTLLLCIFSSYLTFGQIVSSEDSTYSAIAYWSKSDTMIYDVEFKKYKVDKGDTTFQLFTTYSMEISVIDSTEKSYVIRTKYVMDSIYTPHAVIKDIMKTMGNMSVDIETTENGTVNGVKNWKEISSNINQAIEKLQKSINTKSDFVDDFLKNYKKNYITKSALDNSAIQDVQQMFYFHGLEYPLGQPLETNGKQSSLFSGNVLSTKGEITYDTLYVEDGVAKLVMFEQVNQDQLKKEIDSFMVDTVKMDPKKKEDFECSIYNYNTTYIDIFSGWVINSFQDKVTSVGDSKNIQERSIKLR